MKTNIILIAGLVLGAITTTARAADADFSAIEQTIERALCRSDEALLTEADNELAAAAKAEPEAARWRYLAGFAAYTRATFQYATKDKKALESGLVRADELLAKVKGEPWSAEALGLRGYITGQLIGVRGRMSGMTLGPKMARQTSAALDDAPTSGRALTFQGVTLLNTPEMYGGDPAEALKLLTKAVGTFEKKPVAESLTWGEAQAWYWLTKARIKAGDLEGAKVAAEEALKREPDYKVVRYGLLPEIEKKLAKK